MKAKKSYGQHFLTSDLLAKKIVDHLQPNGRYDMVLEVGPGKGILTQFLIQRSLQLKVVEADRDMVTYLEENFEDLDIIFADFLKVNLQEEFSGQFGLIGNFPYNISSQILFKLLKHRAFIPEMVGMFQKEVAARIVAGPGSKTYGILSVLTQAYYDAEMLFTVKPGSFNPPPKVQSAVIRLSRKEECREDYNPSLFKAIVKSAFNQRRKMLRNSLKPLLPENFDSSSIWMTRRPEQMSLNDFIDLTKKVEEEK